jgi:hypothetical protein
MNNTHFMRPFFINGEDGDTLYLESNLFNDRELDTYVFNCEARHMRLENALRGTKLA